MNVQQTITISLEEYQQLTELKSRFEFLKQELAELKRLIFGSKRERFIPSSSDSGQCSLFELPETEELLQTEEEITYKRKKSRQEHQPLRMEIPAHLPRKVEYLEPENLPEGAIKIGEVYSEYLEYQKAEIYVRRIIRSKYIARSTDEQTDIRIAELPSFPIPKGNAGSSLLAYILVSKYVDHLPFYRQRQMFKRQGLDIAESTMNGWFSATCRLLEPLYEALKKKLLSSDYLQADETPLPVLTKDKPGATHKGYDWVYHDPVKRLVLFDYRKSRSREGPDDVLKDFYGFLQTDGYEAYSNLKNNDKITLLACMAHARRYFDKAKDNDSQRAESALLQFQKLYAIERQASEGKLNPDEIKSLRAEKSVPVLEEVEAWLKEEIYNVLPKSAIGKAIAYTLNLWPRLIRYVDDGRLQIDNNLIENAIRPLALGRKNYLFAGSHDAAQNAAMIYSFFATCKINNVEPFQWLNNTLDILPDYPANQLEKLLPGQV